MLWWGIQKYGFLFHPQAIVVDNGALPDFGKPSNGVIILFSINCLELEFYQHSKKRSPLSLC